VTDENAVDSGVARDADWRRVSVEVARRFPAIAADHRARHTAIGGKPRVHLATPESTAFFISHVHGSQDLPWVVPATLAAGASDPARPDQ